MWLLSVRGGARSAEDQGERTHNAGSNQTCRARFIVTRARGGEARKADSQYGGMHAKPFENHTITLHSDPQRLHIDSVVRQLMAYGNWRCQVNAGAGRKGLIVLREGETPAAVAASFARIWALPPATESRLTRAIEIQLHRLHG